MSLKNLSDKYKEELEKFNQQAREELAKELKELFDKYPDVNTVGFSCYAAYFNDGDECPFYARYDDDQLLINGNTTWDWDTREEAKQKPYKEFSSLFAQIPHSIYENMFGNDSEITFYRDGKVEVTEYTDHD